MQKRRNEKQLENWGTKRDKTSFVLGQFSLLYYDNVGTRKSTYLEKKSGQFWTGEI